MTAAGPLTMSGKMDWERAKRRDALRTARKPGKTPDSAKRLHALERFAQQHTIRCFVCDRNEGTWAKTGISLRGPWGICVPCANRPRE